MSQSENLITEEHIDPTYGHGGFVRRIKIRRLAGQVLGALEDDCHALSVTLDHDAHKITRVDAEWQRYPTTTCPGSREAIKAMEGCPLSEDFAVVKRFTDGLQQCTHIHDLTVLMVLYAARSDTESEPEQDYLFEVLIEDPDVSTGLQKLSLSLNGEVIMAWDLKHGTIQAPPRFAGARPLKGFLGWVIKRLELNGDELRYAFILQMAYFVSTSRFIDFEKLVGMQAQQVGHPANACYASQPQRMPDSFKMSHKRYLWESKEELLNFVDF